MINELREAASAAAKAKVIKFNDFMIAKKHTKEAHKAVKVAKEQLEFTEDRLKKLAKGEADATDLEYAESLLTLAQIDLEDARAAFYTKKAERERLRKAFFDAKKLLDGCIKKYIEANGDPNFLKQLDEITSEIDESLVASTAKKSKKVPHFLAQIYRRFKS